MRQIDHAKTISCCFFFSFLVAVFFSLAMYESLAKMCAFVLGQRKKGRFRYAIELKPDSMKGTNVNDFVPSSGIFRYATKKPRKLDRALKISMNDFVFSNKAKKKMEHKIKSIHVRLGIFIVTTSSFPVLFFALSLPLLCCVIFSSSLFIHAGSIVCFICM